MSFLRFKWFNWIRIRCDIAKYAMRKANKFKCVNSIHSLCRKGIQRVHYTVFRLTLGTSSRSYCMFAQCFRTVTYKLRVSSRIKRRTRETAFNRDFLQTWTHIFWWLPHQLCIPISVSFTAKPFFCWCSKAKKNNLVWFALILSVWLFTCIEMWICLFIFLESFIAFNTTCSIRKKIHRARVYCLRFPIAFGIYEFGIHMVTCVFLSQNDDFKQSESSHTV